VASLHGFWRTADDEAVRSLFGPLLGPLAFAVLVAAVVAGFALLVRQESDRAAPLIAVTAIGLLMGAGITGPIGFGYQFAFDHLPLFEAMREQQKWVALALVGYAVAFAAAVEWLALRVREKSVVLAVPLVGVPLVIAPTLFWGLGGSISTSQYPPGWWGANLAMGRGEGLALFLPWHAYQPFTFSQNRTIATPANAFFDRTVLTSDAVELPGLRTDSTSLRTAYLDRLMADAGGGALGRLVAPLGVDYVVLAKTPEYDDYSWVSEQPDLHLVLDTQSMTVFRVLPQGTGRVVQRRVATYEQALQLAASGQLGTEAVTPTGDSAADAGSDAAGGLRKAGATQWQVDPGPPGWVVIPEEYSPGWQVAGRSGVPTLSGTVALEVGGDAAVVDYAPWRMLLPATLGSIAVLLLLVAGGLVEHRRALVARWGRSASP
jgi:hypothetical protein